MFQWRASKIDKKELFERMLNIQDKESIISSTGFLSRQINELALKKRLLLRPREKEKEWILSL